MWHVTCHMLHVTCCGRWTFSKNVSFLDVTVCCLWYFEDLEEKADWLTDKKMSMLSFCAVKFFLLKTFAGQAWCPAVIDTNYSSVLNPKHSLINLNLLNWHHLRHTHPWKGLYYRLYWLFLIPIIIDDVPASQLTWNQPNDV